jgi:hypothetical protein
VRILEQGSADRTVSILTPVREGGLKNPRDTYVSSGVRCAQRGLGASSAIPWETNRTRRAALCANSTRVQGRRSVGSCGGEGKFRGAGDGVEATGVPDIVGGVRSGSSVGK